MKIKKFVTEVLTLDDLQDFTKKELALVYAGQSNSTDDIITRYYDSKYYDTKYYDTKYYDTKYYDTKYYERGSGYDTDRGGRRYGDSSYSDSGC